ncbi:hypothetical protein [Arenimonas daejeonensis]|uniref:hypothetical protein n=1 Tax=Arenimonas daejeonensis TaxID=370777 RepID=UPI003CCD282D
MAIPPPARHDRPGPGHRNRAATDEEHPMAKGLNQKKTEKKKPEKSLKEKREAKQQKKASKG